ncbi:MAG: BadF/BadG/BcrA/BcrD ATPase family protein [bacterium JZ-2024 1]
MMNRGKAFRIGLDVGSTTVKAVVLDTGEGAVVWKSYQPHQARQPEKVLEFLERILKEIDENPEHYSLFLTGSGGRILCEYLNAVYVQEVNAVAIAVEKIAPEAGSVVELGGQDAKVLIWQKDPVTGKKRVFSSMNDKCAGGTGATIEKILAKLGLNCQEVAHLPYEGVKVYPVAGKCGVFAEIDINSLQKAGVPPRELLASLFDALVLQNLSVLTRGNTLLPEVLLLGGPNTFFSGLQQAWRKHILKIWQERGISLPEGKPPEKLIYVPQDSLYFAALGCCFYGDSDKENQRKFCGVERLKEFLHQGRAKIKQAMGEVGLIRPGESLEEFRKKYTPPPFNPPDILPGQIVEAYMGIDAGSTSTKGVLLSREGQILAKAYTLSQGNPLEDTQEIVRRLENSIASRGGILKILGFGVTGYAKDMLKETVGADVALVETVAHVRAALQYFREVDVIVDVGGQDIKVIFLQNGQVKDFRLNTQCSAGNGYFLQSTAKKFGYEVTEFADVAFTAPQAPRFSYGCAVFLEQDIVNFQQLGWQPNEILAGMAKVLPKNIWLYVVQEPNLKRLGRRFVLQGGTQYNLAAVKAQVDFLKSRIPDAEIFVHPHCGECGAIGVALEVSRLLPEGNSRFIGIQALMHLQFTTQRDESTRCIYCKNRCLRTFVDAVTTWGEKKRYIIATCEKGTVESLEEMKSIKVRIEALKEQYPNFVEILAKEIFQSPHPPAVYQKDEQISLFSRFSSLLHCLVTHGKVKKIPSRKEVLNYRKNLRIGIPRVLNMYSTAPFFTAYFESLGITDTNIVWSDYTSDALYREGCRLGAIDPCFPAKVTLAHCYQLLYKKKIDVLFFPMLKSLPTDLEYTQNSLACPTVAANPETVKAAFMKEENVFEQKGIQYWSMVLDMAEKDLLEKELYEFFREKLWVSREENRRALEEGFNALRRFYENLQRRARKVLDELEREGRVGIVLLGRPYHADRGLNHDILTELQKMGYPIFSMESLPRDNDLLIRLFGLECQKGEIRSPMDISDVWKNSYSENTNRKIWAAKFVSLHPNLVAVDLSNFKCGHDAPIYSVVESILRATDTPYFTFHDIDENKPSGSIKIRVETIYYFLRQYEDKLKRYIRWEREQEPAEYLLSEESLRCLENLSPEKEWESLGKREPACLRAK